MDNFKNTDLCKIIPFHFSKKMEHLDPKEKSKINICVVHSLIFESSALFGITGILAKDFLNEYSEFDFIISGDNHKFFMVKGEKGNILINCGSISRQNADQINYKPAIIYLDTNDINNIKKISIPINDNVINKKHLDEKKEKTEKINSFIQKLNNYEISLSFEKNLMEFFKKNKVDSLVENKIWEIVQ